MILAFFFSSMIVIGLLIALIGNIQSIQRHDQTKFKMATLRGDVYKFLRNKKDSISKVDAADAINLIDKCDWIISNHDMFYGELFKFSDFKNAIIQSKKGVDNVEYVVDQVKNKTIKKFYLEFGSILLKNIGLHVKFFTVKLLWLVVTILASVFLKKQLKKLMSFNAWYTGAQKDYSEYQRKYHLNNLV